MMCVNRIRLREWLGLQGPNFTAQPPWLPLPPVPQHLLNPVPRLAPGVSGGAHDASAAGSHGGERSASAQGFGTGGNPKPGLQGEISSGLGPYDAVHAADPALENAAS